MVLPNEADAACASTSNSPAEQQLNSTESESKVEPQSSHPSEYFSGLENNDDDRPDAVASVRAIASYLSLSDAESISSLYTLLTPRSFFNTENIGQALRCAATPYTAVSHMTPLASLTAHLVEGQCTPEIYSLQDGADLSPRHNSNLKGNALLRSWSQSSLMVGTVLGAGDEEERSEENEEKNGTIPRTCEYSGADAAAGLALLNNNSRDSSPSAHHDMISQRQQRLEQNLYSNRAEHSDYFGHGGTSSSPVPGLVSLSPLDYNDEVVNVYQKAISEQCDDQSGYDDDEAEENRRVVQKSYRQTIQKKLAFAVLSHSKSIRSYCLQAHMTSKRMKRRREQQLKIVLEENTVSGIDVSACGNSSLPIKSKSKRKRKQDQKLRIVRVAFSKILDYAPLSILLDLSEHAYRLSMNTTLASFHLTATTIHALLSTLASVFHAIWEGAATRLNPFALIDAILTLQRNAMDRTSEAIVTGIQSVATGVGSAGTAAMHVFSRGGSGGASSSTSSRSDLSGGPSGRVSGMRNSNMGKVGIGGTGSTASSFLSKMNLLRNATSIRDSVVSEKMFRKLNKIDNTSKVISYLEREDEVLTQHAKKRVQRMMHYHVSLRPFVATIAVPASNPDSEPFGNVDFPSAKYNASTMTDLQPDHQNRRKLRSTSDMSDSSSDSLFMCTPKSFPPTPSSRAHVMARGTRFAEDVVFLARDQLRVEGGLGSVNAQTRAMAKALKDGSRLAVFNAADAGSGISLTCGQHCATKVGNDMYCSIRGLSTLEMPMNSLVGAWKGSVGLCTTGQILSAGQWYSPSDPRLSSYGSNSTIGCLVYLDDGSAFETWDGVMVTAIVTFNVNGEVVMAPTASSTSCGRLGASVASSGSRSLKNFSNSGDRRRSSNVVAPTTSLSTLPLFVPREEELFPTLTLHSSDTEVLCRFCSDDITVNSREEIGAPSKVTIYSVDGSVLFDDDTDEHYPLDDGDSMSDNSINSLSDDDGETRKG